MHQSDERFRSAHDHLGEAAVILEEVERAVAVAHGAGVKAERQGVFILRVGVVVCATAAIGTGILVLRWFWGMSVSRRPRLTSCRSKRPLGCSSGLHRLKCSRSAEHQPIDHPGWRTSGRGAEVRRQCRPGFVHSRRPALITPLLGHGCDRRRVSDLLGDAFHDEVELVGCQAQRTSGVASEILPLPSVLTSLEREGVVDPQRPNARDVWTAVLIDRRQPTGVPIGPTSAGSLAHALGEADRVLPQSRSGSP